MKHFLTSPSSDSLALLKLFGIDTDTTIEAHIHFVPNEPVRIETLRYAIVDEGMMAEVVEIKKHYLLVEEENV